MLLRKAFVNLHLLFEFAMFFTASGASKKDTNA